MNILYVKDFWQDLKRRSAYVSPPGYGFAFEEKKIVPRLKERDENNNES